MRRWDMMIILYDDIRLKITAKRKKTALVSRSVGYPGAHFIDWMISSFLKKKK